MSIRTAALHTPAELAFVGADDTTGIVTFQSASKSRPGTPNTVSLDTLTGAILCGCKGAECGRACWHGDHILAAWLRTPAMADVRWLTNAQLARYGAKTAAMVATYRARTGRVLQADQVNLVAARSEWRRRQAVPLAHLATADLSLAA